jgi:hypothetical protein
MISETEQMPEWRKAWKVDDPQWVKERKAKWKEIKKHLPEVAWFVSKNVHKELKNYFFYGHGVYPAPAKEDWRIERYDPNRPLGGTAAALFECWLTPDRSDENFQRILARHVLEKRDGRGRLVIDRSPITSSRSRFRELMAGHHFPAQGSLLDGLEERLYYLFGPTRGRREDFPDLSDKEFRYTVSLAYGFSVSVLKRFLFTDAPNPYDIAPYVVPEYCDSMVIYYELLLEEDSEKRVIDFSKQAATYLQVIVDIANGEREATEIQQQVARRLLDCLPVSRLPKIVRRNIEPVLVRK